MRVATARTHPRPRDLSPSPVIHSVHTQQYGSTGLGPIGSALRGFAMTDWKTDLDEFVKETMAFAKSLRVEPPMPRTIVEPDRIPPMKGIESEREEIRQRVANFKAHQQALHQGAGGLTPNPNGSGRSRRSVRPKSPTVGRASFWHPLGPRRRLIRTAPG